MYLTLRNVHHSDGEAGDDVVEDILAEVVFGQPPENGNERESRRWGSHEPVHGQFLRTKRTVAILNVLSTGT